LRSGIAVSPQGGGAGRDEGTVGGIPFKEDPNVPVRAAACRWEVPPESARTSSKERNDPAWRTCLTNPQTQRGPERVRRIEKGKTPRVDRGVWENEAEKFAW